MRLPFRLVLKRLMRTCFLLLVAGLIPFFLWFQTQDPEAYRFNGMVESEAETVGRHVRAFVLDEDAAELDAEGTLLRAGAPRRRYSGPSSSSRVTPRSPMLVASSSSRISSMRTIPAGPAAASA